MNDIKESVVNHKNHFGLDLCGRKDDWVVSKVSPDSLDGRIRVYDAVLARLMTAMEYLATKHERVHVIEVHWEILPASKVFNQNTHSDVIVVFRTFPPDGYRDWASGLLVRVHRDLFKETMYAVYMELPWWMVHYFGEFAAWVREFFPCSNVKDIGDCLILLVARKVLERSAKRRKVATSECVKEKGYYKAVDNQAPRISPDMLVDLTRMNRDVCTVVTSYFVQRPWYDLIADLFTAQGPGCEYTVEPLCDRWCLQHLEHVSAVHDSMYVW